MELPADMTLHILGFLDPPALAKVAQLSKSWNKLIYRNEIWKPFLWKFTSDIRMLNICDTSKHIGSEREDCFWTWALRYNSVYDTGVLSLERLRALWILRGKPCHLLKHYRPETCLVYDFSDEERKKIFNEHLVLGGHNRENLYAQYVHTLLIDVWSIMGGRLAHLRNNLDTLREKSENATDKRLVQEDIVKLEKIILESDRLRNAFVSSYQNLTKIDRVVFESNSLKIRNTDLLYKCILEI